MHRFSRGRQTQVLMQLAAAALAALVISYAVASLVGSYFVLALVCAAIVFFSLSWMYARMRRQKDEHLRHRALYDSLTNLPSRSLFVDRVDRALNRSSEGSI